jgi:hypothetical protein
MPTILKKLQIQKIGKEKVFFHFVELIFNTIIPIISLFAFDMNNCGMIFGINFKFCIL